MNCNDCHLLVAECDALILDAMLRAQKAFHDLEKAVISRHEINNKIKSAIRNENTTDKG